MKKGTYVAIATVKFKAGNTNPLSPMRWKPSTITAHMVFVCPKYDEKKVKWKAEEKAEAWAKELESQNRDLMVTYKVKMEKIRANSVDVMDDDCKVITL